MTTNAVCIEINPEGVVHALRQEAVEAVNRAEGEVVLDFASVLRIDANAVRALEELADVADGKAVQIVLRGVNLDIYMVLKLLRLAERFSFVS